MKYYYDDAAMGSRWQSKDFLTDTEALQWFEKLVQKYQKFPCLLYDENFRTVKEIESTSEA